MSGVIYLQQSKNRNYFINPDFAVVQDPDLLSGLLTNSLALPTASLGYLGKTNWWMTSTTSDALPTYSINQESQLITFISSDGVSAIYMGQRLESRDTNKIKNKTVVVSFETSNSISLPVTIEVFRPTTSNDTHGTISSPTQTLIASTTINTTITLTRYQYSFALPDEASKGLEFRFSIGALTAAGTWIMSRLQLEEGSVATDFNCGDYSSELLKCQRYYKIARSSLRGYASVSGGILANEMVWDMFTTPVNILRNTVAQRDNVDASFPQLSNLSAYGGTVSIVSATVGDFYDNGRIWNLLAHIP